MTKIMVVDDDLEATKLLEGILGHQGFEVISVNDSRSAAHKADLENPEMFLLDLMMPEIDGFKLCTMLRQDRKFSFTPIIIITALNDIDSKAVAFGAGANDYITKPYLPNELLNKVRDFIQMNPGRLILSCNPVDPLQSANRKYHCGEPSGKIIIGDQNGREKVQMGCFRPGRIAHEFGRGLQVIEDASLYAVGSSKIERAKEFADQYGGAKIYDSYEALVADPEVDGVYIATPHRFHYENAMLALNAGKPVLCEKPLTVNAAETKKLIEASKKNKVFLMEALWTRYLPIYSVIRKWLDEKAIGEISLMSGTFGFNAPKEKDDRWQNPELAGGTLLDMGIYPIAVSQWVMQSQPKSFVAMGHIGNTNVDELTTFLLKYENDVISQSHSSFMSNHVNDFWIYGSKGSIRIHPHFWGTTKATLNTDGQELTVERPLRAGGFEYQTEEAMRCIRAGLLESPGMTHADTLANMELMDGIRAQIGLKYPFEN